MGSRHRRLVRIMVSAQHARSKAAIAQFIGDAKMWDEAMQQLRNFHYGVNHSVLRHYFKINFNNG